MELEDKVKFGCVASVLTENINKKLYGEVLTIMDASIGDVTSRKAVRSLISQAFVKHTKDALFQLNEKLKEEK